MHSLPRTLLSVTLCVPACGLPGAGSGIDGSGAGGTSSATTGPGDALDTSCFTPDGEAALADESGAALLELVKMRPPTAEESRTAALFWAVMIDGMANGAVRPEFGAAGMYDAMFALGMDIPGIAATDPACSDAGDAGDPLLARAYDCAKPCSAHASAWLDVAILRALGELTIAKYQWINKLAKEPAALAKVTALLDKISEGLTIYSTFDQLVTTFQGDLDGFWDLLVSGVVIGVGAAFPGAAVAGALLVASAAYSVYTLRRDYDKELAKCTAEQAMCPPMSTGTADTGDMTGGGQPGDPCTFDEQCDVNSVCFNQICVGQGLLRVSLSWSAVTDLDLHVRTPDGTEIFYGNKIAGGGELDVDQCASGCDPGMHVENVTFAQLPLVGTYEVFIVNYSGAAAASYAIEVAGAATRAWSGDLPAQGGLSSQTYSFTVGAP